MRCRRTLRASDPPLVPPCQGRVASPTAPGSAGSTRQRPQARLVARGSQQELADAVGSVREVVARVLRDFRLAGLVATAPDPVHILDPAGLHDQCWNPAAG